MRDINLLESSTLTANIQCSLPGEGADVWRPFNFKATFKVLNETDQEALDEQKLSRGDYLREVVVAVEGIPSTKDPATGEDVSALEVAVRNVFTSDAMWGEYVARLSKNSRAVIQREAEAKNFKRSRKR